MGQSERGGRDPTQGDPPRPPLRSGWRRQHGRTRRWGMRCGPGERPSLAAAFSPALARPAAETAPKEKENLFVSACLPTARTSSPAAHPPALRVLLPAQGSGPTRQPASWKISPLISLGGVLPVAVYQGEAPSLRHPASPRGGRELGGGKPGREDLSGSPEIYHQAARREEFSTSQARLGLFSPAVMPLD